MAVGEMPPSVQKWRSSAASTALMMRLRDLVVGQHLPVGGAEPPDQGAVAGVRRRTARSRWRPSPRWGPTCPRRSMTITTAPRMMNAPMMPSTRPRAFRQVQWRHQLPLTLTRSCGPRGPRGPPGRPGGRAVPAAVAGLAGWSGDHGPVLPGASGVHVGGSACRWLAVRAWLPPRPCSARSVAHSPVWERRALRRLACWAPACSAPVCSGRPAGCRPSARGCRRGRCRIRAWGGTPCRRRRRRLGGLVIVQVAGRRAAEALRVPAVGVVTQVVVDRPA